MLSSDFTRPWFDPANGRTFCVKGKRVNEFPRNIRSARVKTAVEGETHGFEKKPGIEKTSRFDEG
jgi:hypothetical protein